MAGGRPKKEAGKKYVKQNITMEPEQLERLVIYCQKEDRPMSWVGIGGYQYLLKLK